MEEQLKEQGRSSEEGLRVPKDTVCQTLQSIIQVHFDKIVEKKRMVDGQKKELWRLFHILFLFLGILFTGSVQSHRMQCRHCWAPIVLCFVGHVMAYVGMAHNLKCMNGFKYQRRCHKLTMGAAGDKLRRVKSSNAASFGEEELEVRYQEPSQPYVVKFKRKWFLFSFFLILTFCLVASGIATVLCL